MKTVQLFVCLALLLQVSCSKDYNIELPPNQSKLTVECYLEDGQPMRALVSESTGLLDTSMIPPVLIPALVVISHGTEKDTLLPFVFVDAERRRAYNYGSSKIVKADYVSGTEYRIDVTDDRGRTVSGVMRFIPPVPISSLTPTFNNNSEAFCLTKFQADPAGLHYYRLVLTKNAPYDSVQLDVLINSSLVNNNNEVAYGSGYDFKPGDSIHARLYHLTPEYYDYLNTLQNAKTALVNPFAVSGEIVSNISGGLGVFAALSYTRKSVLVP